MPLTAFQQTLLADLARERSDDGYLAGGAALHFAPNSARFSDDLDFFHDSLERVATAYQSDLARLESSGYAVTLEVSQPGFIRAIVARGGDATRVDWAHDSAWRFMPLVRDPVGGLLLHPVDLAVNKMLALGGRDEARDFVDILFVHSRVLPIGALIWAAVGKDPGFTPLSLLELLKRRGRNRPEDFARLNLAEPFDVTLAKTQWLSALDDAEQFARSAPPDDAGCLYWSSSGREFVLPSIADFEAKLVVPHFGRLGGVLPRLVEGE
ncbi:MAG: nucleotidyl transferase AbiEii/AbiGii toxin family protein [Gemmatimonadetes bacterium]|nr:nucleotidyl transferase AbiEii/AbiGii toxin family protein [Gemmatimonadota bacterium]